MVCFGIKVAWIILYFSGCRASLCSTVLYFWVLHEWSTPVVGMVCQVPHVNGTRYYHALKKGPGLTSSHLAHSVCLCVVIVRNQGVSCDFGRFEFNLENISNIV